MWVFALLQVLASSSRSCYYWCYFIILFYATMAISFIWPCFILGILYDELGAKTAFWD